MMQQSRIRSSASALTVISEVFHFAFSSNLPAERAWILAGLAIPKEVCDSPGTAALCRAARPYVIGKQALLVSPQQIFSSSVILRFGGILGVKVFEGCSERMEELVAHLVQKWDLQDIQADSQEKEDVFAPRELEPELRQWFSVFSVGAVACVLTCSWVACVLIKAQAAASFSDEQHKTSLEIDVIQKLLQVRHSLPPFGHC